ncbi:BspA family leucine-rich repeat surface protein [Enterococcus faecium]|nr:BspA family leucine-rich repeat surface protein [Enterococcus faecium]
MKHKFLFFMFSFSFLLSSVLSGPNISERDADTPNYSVEKIDSDKKNTTSKSTSLEETSSKNDEVTKTSQESIKTNNEKDESSLTKANRSSVENNDSNNLENNNWGTCSYTFNESNGILEIGPGTLGTLSESPWNTLKISGKEIKKIDLVGKVYAPEYSFGLFSSTNPENQLVNMQEITGNLDISKTNNIYGMFYECHSLVTIDLGISSWDTSKIVYMRNLFAGCYSLKNLDISHWNTSNVETMVDMFLNCKSLKTVDVGSWDTSKVQEMESMFEGCTALSSLNFNNWNTSHVRDGKFKDMFKNCTSISSIQLGKNSTFHIDANLPKGMWIGENSKQGYSSSQDFLSNYDGTKPDIYNRMDSQYWGTSPYFFDKLSGELTLFSGTLGTSNESPWNNKKISSKDVKKIILSGSVSAPSDSQFLFSSGEENKLSNLTEIVGTLDVSQVKNMDEMFVDCYNLTNMDCSNWDTNQVISMYGLFMNCKSLKSINLGSKFKIKSDLMLPDNKWIGSNNYLRYESSVDFINNYDGSHPDTYIWQNLAQLEVKFIKADDMVIGTNDQISWVITNIKQNEQGRTAKSITGEFKTKEDMAFDSEINVEKKNSAGAIIEQFDIPLEYEGAIDGESTYSYTLPDLECSFQYKLTLSGKPWNNTTVSSYPTFKVNTNYDKNIFIDQTGKDISLLDATEAATNRKIVDGILGFKEVPKALEFSLEKLSFDLNEKLIPRKEKKWKIKIIDFRGTKPQSIKDNTITRKDWDLLATIQLFKDSNGKNIPLSSLGISYVDNNGMSHELSDTETLISSHKVNGETPEKNNTNIIQWNEDKGLLGCVHNRNDLRTNESYNTEINFELRSAP